MSMNWYRVSALAWLLTMVSCGFMGGDKKDEAKESPSATAPKLVGRIASINEKERFVLIEGYGEWNLSEELLLSSFGGENERSATLMVSGERMGRYTAADWKSGEVKVGDQVYARPLKTVEQGSEEGSLKENVPKSKDHG